MHKSRSNQNQEPPENNGTDLADQAVEGKEDRRWDVETMTYGFKITSWEGHSAIQVKTLAGSLYLDGEDVQALREHLMKDVVRYLKQYPYEKIPTEEAISIIRGDGK